MDRIPALGLWDFVFRSVSFFPKPTQQHQRVKYRETCRVIPHQTSTPKTKPRFQPNTTILIWTMLALCRRTRSFLDLVRSCSSLRITKPWLKWSSKAQVQQWDMCQEPTELLLIGCLTESIWTQNSNQVCRHQTPTCRHSDKREFHTRWVEQSSSSVLNQPFQLSLLRSEFQAD